MEQVIIILVPILVFVAVALVGGVVLLPGAARRQAVRTRLADATLPADAHVAGPSQSPAAALLHRIGMLMSFGRPTDQLRKELARAGFFGRSAAEMYIGAKIFLLLTGLAAIGLVVIPTQLQLATKVLAVLGTAALLSFVPNMYVAAHRRRRSAEVRNHLPDATDLLEICVSAGMGLDMAWIAVADEIRRVSPVLADEMALTNLEIQLGAPRHQAMRNMSERTGADELSALVAVLVQSERFGTSIADALRQFAESMREHRTSRAEEAAEKMAVKLLIPMVLFIFPAMLIVMVGPAAMRLASVMLR